VTQIIGIIGASGDLGSQLALQIAEYGLQIRTYDRSDTHGTLEVLAKESAIIHVCAPVEAVKNMPPTTATIVLHDSVMCTSKKASERYLGSNAAIAHMLMNSSRTVVVASDAPHHDVIARHFTAIGLLPQRMTIPEHDYMMARSQAPLALLCKTLLPYLYEQADKGLLTPSGQLLADTLQSRELAWTEATIHSILQNAELHTLMHDIQSIITTYQGEN
jgi:hypothetical protein